MTGRDGRGLQNLRDVGGLSTVDGGATRYGFLYRSDAPHVGDTTPADLYWPPRTVLDLRSQGELPGPRHPLARLSTEVIALPLSERAGLQQMIGDSDREDSIDGLYASILQTRGPILAQGARSVARSAGPVLIHCTAGKDRTGILVAALLHAVGVAPEEIVADYLRTQANMPGVLARMAVDSEPEFASSDFRGLVATRPHVVDASESAIRFVLDFFAVADGGAGCWLRAHGLQEQDLSTLRARLIA